MSFSIGKIILFGDSLFELSWNQSDGFSLAPALQHDYSRRLDVVVRGYGGYTSEHARYLIAPLLKEQPNTKLIAIFFGTNDVNTLTPGRFVNLKRYEENIRYIVEYCKMSDLKVMVVGPTVVDELHDPTVTHRDTLLKLQYSQTAEKIAKDLGVGFLDLYHAFLYSVGWKEGDPIPGKRGVESVHSAELSTLLTDGTHFTGKGYKVFYQALTDAIAKYYPELKPENISRKFPLAGDIDPHNVRKSLGLEFSISTNSA